MSIRKRKSKKTDSGYTYQVYFSYVDCLTNQRKNYSKSGFLSYDDAQLFEQKKKSNVKEWSGNGIIINLEK